MNVIRTTLLFSAGVLLVAGNAATAQTRTAPGSGIKISKEQPPATSSTPAATTTTTTTTTVVTPAPAPTTTVMTDTTTGARRMATRFDVTAYNNVTEPNIIAHLATGDSVEVQIAQLAQTRATDQRVKDYATMLVTDNQAHLGKVLHVMSDKNIGSQPLANDPEGARSLQLLNWLTSMTPGAQWDAMFVRAQIRHHQNEIDALNAMRPMVKTEDLRDVVDATLPALTKHRDAGTSVATQLGITLRPGM